MTLINHDINLDEAWEKVSTQFSEAKDNPEHPFRYLTLASIRKNSTPNQRMVVLRDFNSDYEFTIFTDARSHKIKEIKDNDAVSLLFYEPNKKLQVVVEGRAAIVTDEEEKQEYWEKSGSKGAHSYTSLKTPGEIIDQPEKAYNWDLQNPQHFCVIKIIAKQIEFLQLHGHKHIRSLKTFDQGKQATTWLAP